MLRSLLIFSDGGHFLFSKNLDQEETGDNNPNLISSLLSAINMFANSIKAGDINSIEMRNYTLVGKKSLDYNIRFVSIIDRGDKVQECQNFLDICEKSFVDKFATDLKKFQLGEMVNTDKFRAWESELDYITSEIDFSPIQSVMEDIIKEISSQYNTKKINSESQIDQTEKIETLAMENKSQKVINSDIPEIIIVPTEIKKSIKKKKLKTNIKKKKPKKSKKAKTIKKKTKLKKAKSKKTPTKSKKTSKKQKKKKK